MEWSRRAVGDGRTRTGLMMVSWFGLFIPLLGEGRMRARHFRRRWISGPSVCDVGLRALPRRYSSDTSRRRTGLSLCVC